jgi:hypothetical protein
LPVLYNKETKESKIKEVTVKKVRNEVSFVAYEYLSKLGNEKIKKIC